MTATRGSPPTPRPTWPERLDTKKPPRCGPARHTGDAPAPPPGQPSPPPAGTFPLARRRPLEAGGAPRWAPPSSRTVPRYSPRTPAASRLRGRAARKALEPATDQLADERPGQRHNQTRRRASDSNPRIMVGIMINDFQVRPQHLADLGFCPRRAFVPTDSPRDAVLGRARLDRFWVCAGVSRPLTCSVRVVTPGPRVGLVVSRTDDFLAGRRGPPDRPPAGRGRPRRWSLVVRFGVGPGLVDAQPHQLDRTIRGQLGVDRHGGDQGPRPRSGPGSPHDRQSGRAGHPSWSRTDPRAADHGSGSHPTTPGVVKVSSP